MEILWEQLPDYFKPVLDYQEIIKAHGYALQAVDAGAGQVYGNLYIQTADEATIAWWENLLGLQTQFGDTLEFRRARVLQKVSAAVPFSIGFLHDQLTALFGAGGYTVDVDPVELTLTVNVNNADYGALDLLFDLLWDVIPAHLQILASQQVITAMEDKALYVGASLSSFVIQTIGG